MQGNSNKQLATTISAANISIAKAHQHVSVAHESEGTDTIVDLLSTTAVNSAVAAATAAELEVTRQKLTNVTGAATRNVLIFLASQPIVARQQRRRQRRIAC